MEWIRISENKLKIMLTAEDAKRYALRCETLDLADSFTRQAFRDILSDIRPATGFDAAEEKVYIQMYPSKEGGCELFVTKMGLLFNNSEQSEHAKPSCEPKSAEPTEKEKTSVRAKKAPRRRKESCSFGTLSDLLAACSRLLAANYSGESTAWRDEAGKYWLLLNTTEPDAPSVARRDSPVFPLSAFLCEYGKRENAQTTPMFLSEHGTCICPVSAVEILGMLK